MHPISRLAAVAAVAAVALTPVAASAQTVEACYAKKSGTVYRINVPETPTQCSNGHYPFSWNVVGPQGPMGPQGPQGPSGTLTGYGVWSGQAPVPANSTTYLTRSCPPGYSILSGGFQLQGDPSGIQMWESQPLLDKTGWRYVIRNNGAQSVTIATNLVCADL